jgi:hypothetical protein
MDGFTFSLIVVFSFSLGTYLIYRDYKREDKHKKKSKEIIEYYGKKINYAYTKENALSLWNEIYSDERHLHRDYISSIQNFMLILNTRIELFNYIEDNPL